MIDYTKRRQQAPMNGAGPRRPQAPPEPSRGVANWDQLASHLHARYAVSVHGDGYVVLDVFSEMDGEPGVVSVRHSTMKGSQQFDWAVIEAPIAEVGRADPLKVAARAGLYMLGGIVADGEYLSLRHAVAVQGLDIDDFDHALDAVGSIAHKIEAWLLGTYRY